MKRSTWVALAISIVVLGGCGSFNNSFNTYHLDKPIKEGSGGSLTTETALGSDDEDKPAHPPMTIQGAPQKIIIDADKPSCDTSPYPLPGVPPEIPLKELQAAGTDIYAVERIERQHIKELRAYIMERRRLNREARDDFNKYCTTSNKR